jgi:ubiquinone/menaquinone biosynthesis C-methylase UbiE
MESDQSKKQIAAFYEEHQKRGKYDYLYGDEARKDLFVRLVGKGHSILEVGCRAGNMTQHYAQGNQVVGCDVDRNALKLFEERLGLKGIWLDADQEPLPFPDASFDVVVFAEVLEHLRFPARALRETARVLKPDGRVVGSVPNAFRIQNRLRFLLGKPYEVDPSHLRSYSVTLLRKQLDPYLADIDILPVSGHLLGGGRTGIPIFRWMPYRIKALFALDLIFVGKPLPFVPACANNRRE